MDLPALVLDLDAALTGGEARGPRRPWLSWMLVALCRQRARQNWLAEVARERLDRRREDRGAVPGLPLWSFYFHGRGLCLTGPNNEVLDVDFYGDDDGPQTIDPHFFITRVLDLNEKPGVEERAASWLGESRELMVEALSQLRIEGLLGHPSSEHAFHLHPWLEDRYREVAAVDFGDRRNWSRWTHVLGGAPGYDEEHDNAFADWALELLSERSRARVIEGLGPLLPTHVLREACIGLMAGPIDSVTGRSVRVLRQLGQAPGEEATALLQRIDPAVHNPFSAVELAEWLFEHGEPARALGLIQRFADQRVSPGFRGNPFDDNYAVLALRFAPAEALRFVRLALRSQTPNAVENTAALLSVLDEPWCRTELLAAADERTDRTSVRFLVGCLMHSSDEPTRRTAMALLPPSPDFDQGRPGYTFEEVQFLNLRENVEHRRSEMRAVAEALRPH